MFLTHFCNKSATPIGALSLDFMLGVELGMAIVVASLLGSVHCVAMCGPFALIASRPRSHEAGSGRIDVTANMPNGRGSWLGLLTAYHLGRLSTYLVLGGGAGICGHWIGRSDLFSNARGFVHVGGVVGCLILAVGIWRAYRDVKTVYARRAQAQRAVHQTDAIKVVKAQENLPLHAGWIARWSKGLATVRKMLQLDSRAGNAYLWGATTTLLPCGWLYMFVLAAMAAPNLGMSLLTMAAFWIGTLPLLSAVAGVWGSVSGRVQHLASPISNLAILGMGLYLIFARGLFSDHASADLHTDKSHFAIPVSHNPASYKDPSASTDGPQADDQPNNESTRSFMERMRAELNKGLPLCIPTLLWKRD